MARDPALALADGWQRDFPVCPQPFERLAEAAGIPSVDVLARLADLKASGLLSRIGAAVRPNTIGSSTLAALSAPAERLEAIAAAVSAHPAVNHNYEREHRFNLWFVVTAPDRPAVVAILDHLAAMTGRPILDLPIVRPYHIDLGFRLEGERRRGVRANAAHPGRLAPTEAEKKLIAALEDGLPLVPRPYLALAKALGQSEEQVMATVAGLIARGVFSRFGCILRHRAMGFRANAMAVWDVPDDVVDAHAGRLAAQDAVTLCYRRIRRPPHWPYNLFAMVHGRDTAEVQAQLAEIARITGLSRFPAAILFSRRCFKQESARYFFPQRGAA